GLHRPRHRGRPVEGRRRMAKMRIHLTFPPEQIKDPVIYLLGKDFNLVTNIRRADVTATHGWVALEIEGGPGRPGAGRGVAEGEGPEGRSHREGRHRAVTGPRSFAPRRPRSPVGRPPAFGRGSNLDPITPCPN